MLYVRIHKIFLLIFYRAEFKNGNTKSTSFRKQRMAARKKIGSLFDARPYKFVHISGKKKNVREEKAKNKLEGKKNENDRDGFAAQLTRNISTKNKNKN